jgi:putative DNA primase/helicase
MPDDEHWWDAAAAAELRRRHSEHRACVSEVDAMPPQYSDEALALRFSEKHGDSAQYVAAWGKWLWWAGAVWETDVTLRTFDLARAIFRTASAELPEDKSKLASAIASAKTVAAVVTLARADRRHAAITDQWDADPWCILAKRG